MSNTPKELGFSMPAEWAPHEATWLSWPNPEGISFPGSYEKVLPTFGKLITTISESETVRLNVSSSEMEKLAKKHIAPSALKNVEFFDFKTNEPWCRDHGPVFVKNKKEVAILDWEFNAWGEKYEPWDSDNSIPQKISNALKLRSFKPQMILEGGSIDVNGEGKVLTTESCLLNPNRNSQMSKSQIEQKLKENLNVSEVIWLKEGLQGDDTDGHIDDLTRFISKNQVVTVFEENPESANYKILKENFDLLRQTNLEIIKLPTPRELIREETVLPASYANFYICNKFILLPTFQDKNDEVAKAILKDCFSNHEIRTIDSLELIWGLGSFHCLTQQQPSL
jgi:agmatine deiminase